MLRVKREIENDREREGERESEVLVPRLSGFYCLPPKSQHPFGGARCLHRHLATRSGPSSSRQLQLVEYAFSAC